MKKLFLAMVVASALVSTALHAQAPAGSTGQCKDGTYTTAKSKRGACSGHGGVQTWMAAAAPAPTSAAPTAVSPKPASVSTPAAAAQPTPVAPAPASMRPTPAAPANTSVAQGGGPGMVWVNLPTKIYHCPGTRFYGTTKSGKYMSEADAQAMGARGDHNKTCSK